MTSLVLDHEIEIGGSAMNCSGRGGWTLAIDFGTTYTVAAVVGADGTSRLIDLEGDGSCKMPSAIVRTDDGDLVVGRAAVRQAVLYPASFEATPKRLVGQGSVLLGDELLPVVDLVAAVLRHAADEARCQQGGTEPSCVRLTHPAKWAGPRLDVLRAAGIAAGLGEIELIPEPVAAASRIGSAMVEVGQRIAVYDFGGGTFDAAVLVRTSTGFDVAGDPGGRDPLGGEDIDERILQHLCEGPLGESPEWSLLMSSTDPIWRRHRAELRRRVREAKEDLSKAVACTLWIPGLERDYQLNRRELNALIEVDVRHTVDELAATIAAADSTPAELAGIYLVGGSSRITLVTELIRERFGIEPAHFEDPKAIVAIGGAMFAVADEAPGVGTGCHLGAVVPTSPGPVRRVEHWLSVDAGRTFVHSVLNRWSSTEAYAADAQHRAYLRGEQFDAPSWGTALGAGGAMLFTSSSAAGDSSRSHARVSSYQVMGPWAVHASRPATDTESIAGFRASLDPAQWSMMRPPIELTDGGDDGLVETLIISAPLGGMPVDVTTTAVSMSITAGDRGHWTELFLARLIQHRPGTRTQSFDGGTFGTGHQCRLAKLRGPGLRAWCWYGVVGDRGVSITVESQLPVPIRMALRLRDAVALFG